MASQDQDLAKTAMAAKGIADAEIPALKSAVDKVVVEAVANQMRVDCAAAGAQRLARGVKEAAGTKMVRAVKAASNTKE